MTNQLLPNDSKLTHNSLRRLTAADEPLYAVKKTPEEAMKSKLALTLATLSIATAAYAGEAKDTKHRWVVPVYVS
jgi:hypothetical protein